VALAMTQVWDNKASLLLLYAGAQDPSRPSGWLVLVHVLS
jgi:hypothetical protein